MAQGQRHVELIEPHHRHFGWWVRRYELWSARLRVTPMAANHVMVYAISPPCTGCLAPLSRYLNCGLSGSSSLTCILLSYLRPAIISIFRISADRLEPLEITVREPLFSCAIVPHGWLAIFKAPTAPIGPNPVA